MNFFKNKNLKIILLSALVLALLINFGFNVPNAEAAGTKFGSQLKTNLQSGFKSLGSDIASASVYIAVIYVVLFVILQVLLWFFDAASQLINAAFAFATRPEWYNNEAVTAAWTIIRNFANIWFIFLLLFVAIATILRVQRYQAKEMVLWIIIMAILINFSLPITKIIIDVSNILTFQFVKTMGVLITNEKTNGRVYDIAGTIENSVGVRRLINDTESDYAVPGLEQEKVQSPEKTQQNTQGFVPVNQGEANTFSILPHAKAVIDPISIGIGVLVWIGLNVVAPAALGWVAYQIGFAGVILNPIINLLISNILIGFAVYVIISLAIFLLIRTVALMFLVATSPAGFLLSAFPGFSTYSSKWWSALLNQAFFAPAVAFLLWLSLSLTSQIQMNLNQQGLTNSIIDLRNGRIIFFVLTIILLYMSLRVARDMGAYGAETAIGLGKKIKDFALGGVKGFAKSTFVAPIGKSLEKTGVADQLGRIPVVGPVLGRQANKGVDWLKTRGAADKIAQEEANLGMKLPESQRAGYFGRLNLAGKEALLRKMSPDERARFMENLEKTNPRQKKIAEGIMGSALFRPGERAQFDIATYKRMTSQQQYENFDKLSEEAQSDFLHGMDASKQAEFKEKLNADGKRKLNDLIASPRFSQKEKQDFKIAEIMQQTEEEKHIKFASELNDADKETMLRKMSDDQKTKFLAGYRKTPPAQLSPQQLANWNSADATAHNIISTKFTDSEKRTFEEAEDKQWIKDNSSNFSANFINLTNPVKERIFKTASDYQKAELAFKLRDSGNENAIRDLSNKLTPEEKDKFYKENANYVARQKVADIERIAPKLENEELDYFVRSADIFKVSELLNTTQNNIVLGKIGTSIRRQGSGQKLAGSVRPNIYVEEIKGIARLDPTGNISDNYKTELKKHYATSDPKVLRNLLTPEIIKQPEIFDDLLIAGSLKNFADITTDSLRAAAVKEKIDEQIHNAHAANHLQQTIQKINTDPQLSREYNNLINNYLATAGGIPGAQALAQTTAINEMLNTNTRARAEALAEILESKTNTQTAQQIRDQLSQPGAPNRPFLERLLKGEPPKGKLK
ncbi:hypothetical protein HYS99_00585 [Candidatus Giovannonibacteria bacterium]|nr:hypothetical protein [Candidatus Giovannonibacteria bacterium]